MRKLFVNTCTLVGAAAIGVGLGAVLRPITGRGGFTFEFRLTPPK